MAASSSSSIAGLSASVTRILSLTGFPKELKTKDIQSAFSEWDGQAGGFKIKWRDDTSLLIVFQDAVVAKRAYLSTVAYPPPILTSASTGISATIRPYDGPDAQSVIQNVNARTGGAGAATRGHAGRSASISVFPTTNSRASFSAPIINGISGINPNAFNMPPFNNAQQQQQPQQQQFRQHHAHSNTVTIPLHSSHIANSGREPSPTLPTLPSHPTLNSLINLSLSNDSISNDPAVLAASSPSISGGGSALGPRVGDPARRMVGAALGVRHPGLGRASPAGVPNNNGSADQALREVQRAMGGLVVAE